MKLTNCKVLMNLRSGWKLQSIVDVYKFFLKMTNHKVLTNLRLVWKMQSTKDLKKITRNRQIRNLLQIRDQVGKCSQ